MILINIPFRILLKGVKVGKGTFICYAQLIINCRKALTVALVAILTL
jgi:hypothetical protein